MCSALKIYRTVTYHITGIYIYIYIYICSGCSQIGSKEDISVSGGGSNRRLEKIALSRQSLFMLLAKYYSGDQIDEHEMGGECGSVWGRGETRAGFCGKT